MKNSALIASLIPIGICLTATVASAQWSLDFSTSTDNSVYTEGAGQPLSLAGEFTFTPDVLDSRYATVEIVLDNPSTPLPIGYLTGFGFRIADGLEYVPGSFGGMALDGDPNISVFSGIVSPFSVSGLGFGDLGSGTGGGGGSPSAGLNPGFGATFDLRLWLPGGGSTASLRPEDFFTGLLPASTGATSNPNDDEYDMLFRFQDVIGAANGGTSAKVGISVDPNQAIPEPSAVAAILSLGMLGVAGIRRRLRSATV